ncbi:MAG: hypothetical protein ACI4WZ_01800 [Eubacteriales bacterium]
MITVKSMPAPEFDRSEILRYAGCQAPADELFVLMEDCLNEAKDRLSYRVCYQISEINRAENNLQFAGIRSDSETLKKALNGCERVVIFAATVGVDIDRLILKYSRIQPSRALIMQALGTERVESLCNAFCEDMKLRPRVSPGYGDIPLTLQREVFRYLDCSRKIGLTLNSQCIMSPTKSVTAFAGLPTSRLF